MRTLISRLVASIQPVDELEQEHIAATLAWIDSGAPLFRRAKPDIPPQHLVSYFVLVDRANQHLLLVDHRNARLWLPGGGHVDLDEDPQQTVCRELKEELGLHAAFILNEPLFVTVTRTVGKDMGHIDVSLWYVLEGDCKQKLTFDVREFASIRWFAFQDIPRQRVDPHMHRFMAKLHSQLEA